MILAARPIPIDSPEPDELVPSFADPAIVRIPLKTDLAMHAVPAVALLIDFFLIERKYTRRQAIWGGTAMTVLACSVYAPWIEYCSEFNGSCKSKSQVKPDAFVLIGNYSPVSLPHGEPV